MWTKEALTLDAFDLPFQRDVRKCPKLERQVAHTLDVSQSEVEVGRIHFYGCALNHRLANIIKMKLLENLFTIRCSNQPPT